LPRKASNVFPKTGTDQRNGRGDLVAVRSPTSAAAEAYRTLRTNLQFSSLDRQLRSVLVTSAATGDGKTTVVANLGATLAEVGKRILLVDCDLRRPGLHEVFGLPAAPGLSNALAEDVPSPPINATAVPGLSVLTAGDQPPNPPEFVASARMGRLLERLQETFDILLIDSSPVGMVADAAVLAQSVDGVVLVLRAGRTKRELAVRAKQQLDQVGARVLGTVLTNAKLEKKLREYHSGAGLI
jgi:capsular exopolysaccharide synthesis family protein